jgi:pyruvate/2-oxoacid:ferredoxin oxidoreductase alpha subunit
MPDSLEAMVARIDERTRKMESEICNKCKQIDRHEDEIDRLKMHDYAEMVLIGAGVLVMGWAIAAGFVHA